MLVGVIADSHDNMHMLKKAVDLFNERGVALVLHAGDYIAPFTAREFRRLNCRLVGVFGNNDGEKFGLAKNFEGFGELHEGVHQLELDGKMVAITHSPEIAETLADRGAYDVVIYGHTHRAEIREREPLVINPGECGGWLEGTSTVALLDLAAMRAELVKLWDINGSPTERPHRPALSSFAALKIMRNEMIEVLDRDLFREFVLLLGDHVQYA